MNSKNKIALIRVVIALLFIVSAVAKLYPSPYFAISTFEVKQLYPLGFSETFAPYFSRILIGIEFALGFAILIKDYLKKITIPATILLLIVFIVHLSYTTFSSGNAGNCGCFGELIPMTPVEAIIKNVIAIVLLIWLYKLLPSDQNSNFFVLLTLFLGCVLALFMLAPMQNKTAVVPQINVLPNELVTIPIDSIATNSAIEMVEKETAVTVEKIKKEASPAAKKSGFANFFPKIDQDKKILCFFAPGCEHCQETAKELTELKRKDASFPEVYIIFMDEEPEKIPDFFAIAGQKYPYQVVDVISFWNLLGNTKDTPGVKYLWNGNEMLFFDGIHNSKFNKEKLVKTIKKEYNEPKN
jgi:thiol-disulfide isomerase/thioredoxin